jgi:hypothetical protein
MPGTRAKARDYMLLTGSSRYRLLAARMRSPAAISQPSNENDFHFHIDFEN